MQPRHQPTERHDRTAVAASSEAPDERFAQAGGLQDRNAASASATPPAMAGSPPRPRGASGRVITAMTW